MVTDKEYKWYEKAFLAVGLVAVLLLPGIFLIAIAALLANSDDPMDWFTEDKEIT